MPPNQTPPQPQNQPAPPPPPEYGYPPAPPQYPAQPESTGLAIASMVLGIVGILTAWILIGLPLALVGLVLGIVSIAKKKGGRGMAIAGIITSALALLFGVAMVAISIIAYQGIGQRAETTQNQSTASQIAKKAEAYNVIMGDAEGAQYPDYQTLVSQTEVPEALIEQSTARQLSDGNQNQASQESPVTYRGCSDGASINYWDASSQRAESIDVGQPTLCSFEPRT